MRRFGIQYGPGANILVTDMIPLPRLVSSGSNGHAPALPRISISVATSLPSFVAPVLYLKWKEYPLDDPIRDSSRVNTVFTGFLVFDARRARIPALTKSPLIPKFPPIVGQMMRTFPLGTPSQSATQSLPTKG